MGRLPRAIDVGLVYHALNRGINRGDVLSDEADCDASLTSLDRTKVEPPPSAAPRSGRPPKR